MPKGQDIRFGPWVDGINLLDQPDQLRDSQLISCVNFDIDNTGVLLPRRGLRYLDLGITPSVRYLLGSITLNTETQPRAMIGAYSGVNTACYAVSDPTAALGLTAIASPVGLVRSVVQYQSKIWYIPGNNTTVGQSSPPTIPGALTAVATMPWGDYGFILKDRLFIVRKSTSELYFSKATDFTNWAAPDGGVIQINPGDNQPITKVVVLNNQIVIFKRDATYVLSFTSSPTGDGVVRQVSADQGAIDAITYNNEVYCYNARSVFKFVNGYFQDIGLQLNLPTTDTIDATDVNPARINVVGKILLFGVTPSGKTYAMNLDTGAWTSYTFPGDISISSGAIFSRSAVGTTIFFGDGFTKLGYMVVTRSVTRRTDLDSAGVYRSPGYSFRTKEYNFDDSETWKRLFSWHLDATFLETMAGNAVTYINGVMNNSSSDASDLVGSSLSYRFRTTSLGFLVGSVVSTVNGSPGPTIRGIRAVIGAKAPVSV